MKKILLATVITGIFSASTFAASDNTIRFQGEVSDETCTVTINGNSAVPVVLLPTVPVSQLDAAGKTAGQTPFTVGVSGCTGSSADKNLKTVFVANNPTSDGLIGNTAANNNVNLEIIDPANTGTKIDLTGVGNSGLVLKANAQSASYDYAVRYKTSNGAATAGKVEGSVQYSISYQ